MNGKHFASVIVPTYNRRVFLDYTFKSILAQKLPKDSFEVIICDDGSSENTKEIVDRYCDQLDLKYLFQTDKGYQLTTVRNMGIRQAKGEICIFLDAGLLLDEHYLSAHVNAHKRSPRSLAAVGPVLGVGLVDDRMEYTARLDPDNATATIADLENESAWADPRDKYFRKYNDHIESLPAPWIFFWGGNFSAKRQHLLEVGMFDENYNGRWGCEDNDLGYRLYMKGVKITVCRGAKSLHYPHERVASSEKQQGIENCRYFLSKYNTREIKIFLDSLTNKEFTDINETLLKDHSAFSVKQTSSI